MTAPEKLSSRDFLLEHCGECTNGLSPLGSHCKFCNGTTRRLRHRFDAASGIDAPESPETLHAAQYRAAEDPHATEFYRVGRPGVEPMPAPVDAAAEARIEKLLAVSVTSGSPTFQLYEPPGPYVFISAERRDRMVALARVLRGPENSAQLAELIDLAEALNG